MKEFNLYFDESGTHISSPTLIMGGLCGSADQFSNFLRLLDQIRSAYQFDIFHATELKGGRRDFQAWTYEKQLALVVDFNRLISQSLLAVATSRIDKRDFELCYVAGQGATDVPSDSAYGLCFRMALIAFLEKIESTQHYRRAPYVVNVTMEKGDPNWTDAQRIFDETKSDALIHFGARPLGAFRTATKQDCPELMIADFLAYTEHLIQTNDPNSALTDEEILALGLPDGEPGEQNHNFLRLSLGPDELRQLGGHLAMLQRTRNRAPCKRQLNHVLS